MKHSLMNIVCVGIVVFGGVRFAYASHIDAVMAYDPIHFWSLDEVNGPIIDRVGNADGQLHGGVVQNRPSFTVAGSATQFCWQGHPGYIEITHRDSFLLNEGTLSFWFKDTGAQRKAGLISKDSKNYDTGGHLTAMTDGMGLSIRLQSASESYYVTSPSISLDQWYHAAFTFGGEGMHLYLNGSLVDSNVYPGGMGSTSGGLGNLEPFVFGSSARHSDDLSATPLRDYYSGLLDDVAIYGRALDGTEIRHIYIGDIPEPATCVLVALGGMALMRRG